MRIEEVKIKNFRSIKSATFRMNKITAVVGENNAGKTAVLRAINAVLNYMDEEMSFKNKTHLGSILQKLPVLSLYLLSIWRRPWKRIYHGNGRIHFKEHIK